MIKIESLKSMFDSDTSCAELLKKQNLIEFSNEFTHAYIWNDKTLLYDKLVSDQYRCVISKILTKLFEIEKHKYFKYRKQIHNENEDDDLLKYEMKKGKQTNIWISTTAKALQTSHKINSIVNMCGNMINAKCEEKY